jgi:hypothetical protein
MAAAMKGAKLGPDGQLSLSSVNTSFRSAGFAGPGSMGRKAANQTANQSFDANQSTANAS